MSVVEPQVVGVRAVYDAVASAYAEQLGDELDHKPLDRALVEAFLACAEGGVVADIGCGPGHVTAFMAARHTRTIGIDLSVGMITAARERAPELGFAVGSMLRLPVTAGGLSGAAVLYSIIHLTPAERALAFAEVRRVLRPHGWLLVAFHVASDEFAAGATNHLTSWFGQSVDLDAFFLDPAVVTADLTAHGFSLVAEVHRQPMTELEYPSRRCYLLAQRVG